jgi:hypothetical protein
VKRLAGDSTFLGGLRRQRFDFSRAVTSSLFFAPSATFLDALKDDQPGGVTSSEAAVASSTSHSSHGGGSLGIGSLKGDIRHEQQLPSQGSRPFPTQREDVSSPLTSPLNFPCKSRPGA